MLRLGLTAVMLLGCGSDPTPRARESCEARVAALRSIVGQIRGGAGATDVAAEDVALPRSRGALVQGPARAVVLVARRDGHLEVNGAPIREPGDRSRVADELARELDLARRAAMKSEVQPPPPAVVLDLEAMDGRLVGSLADPDGGGHGRPGPALPGRGELETYGIALVLAIDAAAPLAPVLTQVGALGGGLPMRLLVVDERAAPSEPPAWLAERVAELRAGNDGSPWLYRLTSCPEALAAAERATGVDASLRAWQEEIPPAVSRCGCEGTDVEGLAALAWIRFDAGRTPLGTLPFALSSEPGAAPMTLAGDASARDLVAYLEGRGDRPFSLPGR